MKRRTIVIIVVSAAVVTIGLAFGAAALIKPSVDDAKRPFARKR